MPPIDTNELGRWFEQEAAALVLYARRWFGRAEAEEVVQEAFMRLMQQRQRPEQVRGWLYVTVRNASISRMRTSARRRLREEEMVLSAPAWFESHPGDLVDAEAVQHALQQLPEDEREIVLLRVWGGMTLKEISEMIGASIPTVFRRYQAALGRLREEMKEPCKNTSN